MSKKHTLRAVLDGPYGGISRKLENGYESVICVAGGGGITSSVPWILFLAGKLAQQTATIRQVRLVWVVKRAEHLQWMKDELVEAKEMAPAESILYDFYITAEPESESERAIQDPSATRENTVENSSDEKLPHHTTTSAPSLGTTHYGRPLLGILIPDLITASRTCILGMSIPPSLLFAQLSLWCCLLLPCNPLLT